MAKPGAQKPAKTKPSPATKASAVKKVNNPVISNELVGNSDSENSPAKVTTTKQNGKTPAKGINGTATKPKAVTRKESISSSESSEEASEADESEDDEDSDGSDDDSDSASLPNLPVPKISKTVPAKINGVKRKAGEQESTEETGSDESESEGEDLLPPNKRVKQGESSSEEESDDTDGQTEEKTGEESSDDPEEELDEESGEESGDDSEEKSSEDSYELAVQATPTPNTRTPAAPRPPSPSSRPQSTAVRVFNPPKGYIPLAQSTTNPPLTASNLTGKQIWHITAPSSVPLSSLTSLAASSHQTGAEVLTHKGTSYALQPDTNPVAPTLRLLLPSSSAAGSYEASPHAISATLHLRPRLALPVLDVRHASGLSGGSAVAASATAPAVAGGPRPQPKGLRMRYRPPGFGRGELGAIGAPGWLDEQGLETSALETAVELAQMLPVDGAGPKEDARGKEKKKDKKKQRKEKAATAAGKGEQTDKEMRYEEKTQGVEETTEKKRELADKARRREEKRARKEAKAKAREVVNNASR